MSNPAKKAGRPKKTEAERTQVVSIRLKPEHKQKLRKLGAKWLAKKLDDEHA